MISSPLVIGLDVGTGSARAGLFDPAGALLASASHPIEMWRPKPDYAEQSSEDIWRALCMCVRTVLREADAAPERVAGISFDATCSLVAIDAAGAPVAVNDEGVDERNVIVWMDHRALAETDEINSGEHAVLKYVGGKLSPEMETPKLLWLKRHLPASYARAAKFFDLADYLTWRATGCDARSLCTMVCKWTYLGHEGAGGSWDAAYFQAIGLDDLFTLGKVSSDIRPMGTNLGPLSAPAAADLGLTTRCRVGVGIIDAHAGGLGVLGALWEGKAECDLADLETGLALIGGTSNCHMAASREAVFVPGIWGPYYGAMVPGMWLTEGGQSTAGSAIDHIISDHANAPTLTAQAQAAGVTVYELLNREIARLGSEQGLGPDLTQDLHILPYFLGNRSPHADPHARAAISGVSLDRSITSQALRYYSVIQAVAYGTRDIIASMNRAGFSISKMLVTGGGTKNPLWLQEHADATGCTLILPREPEAVLLGSAILAATASGLYPDIYRAMQGMSGSGLVIKPRTDTSQYHAAKFQVFQQMYQDQLRYRELMGKV